MIQPTDGIVAIGSGGNYARAAATALQENTELSPSDGGSGGTGWLVDGEHFDSVIIATPAPVAADTLRPVAADASELLGAAESADVILVSLHVAADQWPGRLAGRSGYLVPKPVQRWVTAASFGSQKWSHWRPADGGQILRVSLGRDGQPVLHLDDDEVLRHVLTDLKRHLGVDFAPLEVRISR